MLVITVISGCGENGSAVTENTGSIETKSITGRTFWAGGVRHTTQHDERVIIHHFIPKHCILHGGNNVLQKVAVMGNLKDFFRLS